MITKDIPTDIRRYKTTLFFGFSAIECLSLATAGLFVTFILTWQINAFGAENINYNLCLPGIFPVLFGFYKPYGLPLKTYLKYNWKTLIAPKTRTYTVENLYKDFKTTGCIDDPEENEEIVESEIISEQKKDKKTKKKVSKEDKAAKKAAKLAEKEMLKQFKAYQ